MQKNLFYAIILTAFLFGAADAQKRKRSKPVTQKPQPVKKIKLIEDKDEYAVYQAVLKQLFQNQTGRTIVLNKEVTGCSTIIDRETEKQISRNKLEELFNDCSGKKYGNYELIENYFQPGEKIVLVSEDELGKLFMPSCDLGWKKFYLKFPNSVGNASFSRVGFDSQRNFAVVNFGNQSACLAGGGQIVFLQKENDVWKIKKSQMTWVS